MHHHYDRNGQPITAARAAQLLADKKYRRVLHTKLPDNLTVTTVWLPHDHNPTGSPPLIFETELRRGERRQILRCSSEKEARSNHITIVRRVKRRLAEADQCRA